MPGEGACHHCYLQRTASFQHAPERDRAVRGFFDLNPDAGPSGYPAALVGIGAAALVEDAVAIGVAARVRCVDILTSGVRESEVIGIHHCPRCRKRPAGYDPTRRSSMHLVPRLEGLLHE